MKAGVCLVAGWKLYSDRILRKQSLDRMAQRSFT